MTEVPRDERDPDLEHPADTPSEDAPPGPSHAGPFRRDIASTPAPGEPRRDIGPASPRPQPPVNAPSSQPAPAREGQPPGLPGTGGPAAHAAPPPAVVQPPSDVAPPHPPAATPPPTTGLPHYSPPATPPPWATPPISREPYPQPQRQRRRMWRPLGRGLREVAETVILALLIFLLVRSVVQNFQVEGRSMQPTFEDQWYVLVNKSLYWEINMDTVAKFVPFVDPGDDPTRYLFRGPKRGDVVVFRSPIQPATGPERDFIKRVIGLPGETVEVRDCTVFIDGEPLDEPYIAEKPVYTIDPVVIPPDHYYVLGDNRNNSSDSHSWGALPKDNLIGQAWLIYWPFDAFGLVDNTHVTPGEINADNEPSVPDPTKPVPACS